MKVLHLIPEINKGGTERVVLSLSQWQRAAGYNVKIISFSDRNLYPELCEQLSIEYLSETFFRNRVLKSPIKNTHRLEKLINTFDPDVIHSHSYWTDVLLSGISLQCHPKFFSHLHLRYKEHKRPHLESKLFEFIDWLRLRIFYFRKKFNFIVVSEYVKSFYIKECRFPKSKIHLIPNAINHHFEEPVIKLNYPVTLLSVGRMVREKNFDFLLNVGLELKRRDLAFKMVLAGDGPLTKGLKSTAIAMGLDHYVNLIGNVSNIGDLYKQCDLYLHASRRETFGLTLLEAMSFGKPCICFRAGGNEDFVENNKNGIFIDDFDQWLFADAIEKLVRDKEYYNRLAREAYKTSLKYNMEEFFNKVETLYIKK